MTSTQRTLAWAGAAAVSIGAVLVVMNKPTQTFTAGYWHLGQNIEIPCPSTPPGPNPYLEWINPVDGKPTYLRYDASAMTVNLMVPSGSNAGFGGSDHTEQYYQDGMIKPMKGGTGYKYPAFHLDSPLYPPRTVGDITLGDRYRSYFGDSPVFPSGETILGYSNRIKGTPQWSSGAATWWAAMTSQCSAPAPSPTAVVSKSPTITPTSSAPPQTTPTKTPLPAATCLPTKVVTVVVTASKTPHIGPAPSKTATPKIGPQ